MEMASMVANRSRASSPWRCGLGLLGDPANDVGDVRDGSTCGVEFLEHARRLHHEDAGVPEVLSAGEELLGDAASGFSTNSAATCGVTVPTANSGKRLAGADVAVAGLGAGGLDADRHEVAVGRDRGRRVDAVGPHLAVLEQVVAGQHRHDRVRVLGGEDGGRQRDGGRGVLGQRLLDVAHRVQLGVVLCGEVVAQLVEEALVGGDADRGAALGEGQDAVHGGRDERLGPEHRQELLGVELARQGPEALAAPAGQDGRSQVWVWSR